MVSRFVTEDLVTQVKPKKGQALCQEEIQQGQPARNLKQDALAAPVEAEWVGRLLRDRAETVYA